MSLSGVTLTISDGSVDLLSSLRTVYSTSDYVIYDGIHISGDIAYYIGVRDNLDTDDITFVVIPNYGHKRSPDSANAPSVRRVNSTVDLAWTGGGGGSITGIVVDNDPNLGTLINGQCTPPMVLVWNSVTFSQVSLSSGYTMAFVEDEDLWSLSRTRIFGVAGRVPRVWQVNDS